MISKHLSGIKSTLLTRNNCKNYTSNNLTNVGFRMSGSVQRKTLPKDGKILYFSR